MILRYPPLRTAVSAVHSHARLAVFVRLPASYPRHASSSAHSPIGASNPEAYCSDLVRKHDYESYLVGQFFPQERQGGYYALKAFAVELATVQDNVSDVTIGRMRMQFWRDAIKGMQMNDAPRHPVALALADTMREHRLPSYYLKRIVDARDEELMTPMHMTSESLVSHAESTSSSLLYLQLALLNLSSDSTLSHAASHLGVAQTLTILLRALAFHAKHGRMVIPAEITAKHGVRQEEVFREGPTAKGIDEAVYEFATLANDHLLTARTTIEQEPRGDGRVPSIAMPVFLAGVPVANYLQRLEKANFNAFEPKLQLRDWKLPWHVWRGYYKRMF
ncbi:isoprenoid synthase domain-containing protein [Schizophyllum amplum]|uniref:Isoprenoid synthase domain-containing protein n=1 Tax=Schizophyllum amplum TaxID=97359 RepID=A0A550C7A1_9AGAR|nr:isoprenoid synthase domain-containing protein [Auriculariopsis ampla]